MRFPGYENTKFEKGIPEGWEVKRIGDVAKLVHGYTESADEKPIGPKYLRGTDINKESYINWEEVPYCGIKDTNVDKYKLYKNDIVIIRMADPGKVAIVESNIDAVFASYLIKIDYDKDKVRPYYMFYFLYSDSYREHIKSFSNGTTRSSINSKMILSSKILVPSIQIQEEFNKRSSVIREMLNKLINKNQNLIKQSDLLLPRLMNGTIEVK
jgi:type I restriction enzyme S subunit